MNEPTEEEILLQARVCPVIRGVYGTEDAAAIKRTEEIHPPSMCWHVKNAQTATADSDGR